MAVVQPGEPVGYELVVGPEQRGADHRGGIGIPSPDDRLLVERLVLCGQALQSRPCHVQEEEPQVASVRVGELGQPLGKPVWVR
jgi:hypothetical protein